jgi:hypothetical protein
MNHFEFGFFDELEKIADAVDPSLDQLRQRYPSPRHSGLFDEMIPDRATRGFGKRSRAETGALIHNMSQFREADRKSRGYQSRGMSRITDYFAPSLTFPERRKLGMKAYGLEGPLYHTVPNSTLAAYKTS